MEPLDPKGSTQSSDNWDHSVGGIEVYPSKDFIWFSCAQDELFHLLNIILFGISLSLSFPFLPHIDEKYSDLRFFHTKELSSVASLFLFF